MIAPWMAWSALVAALLGMAAAAAERALAAYGRPARWVWGAALVLSLAAPGVLWFSPERAEAPAAAPAVVEEGGGAGTVLREIPAELVRSAGPALPRLDAPLLLAWAGASAGVLGVLLGLAVLLRRRRREWRAEVVDGYAVLVSPDTGPAVVGLLRSEIVLPRWALEAPAEVRALMLEHEREHLRAGDPRLLLAGIAVAVAMPWSPAVWWQLRRLRLAVETDCDRRVLRRRGDVKAYGTLLLEIGRRASTGVLAVAAFSEPVSFLERRIRTMTTPRSRAPLARAAAFGAVAALAVAAACEAPRPGRINPVASEQVLADDAAPRTSLTGRAEARALVEEHFPAVLTEGTGGRKTLMFVMDTEGRVLRTAAANEPGPERQAADAALRREDLSPGVGRVVIRGMAERVPATGLEVDTDDIDRMEVSKHEAGRLGPDAVSVIVVQLKPGVSLEESLRRAAEERARHVAGTRPKLRGENAAPGSRDGTPRGVVEAAVRQHFPSLRTGDAPREPLFFLVTEGRAVIDAGEGPEAVEAGRLDASRIARVEVFKEEDAIPAGPHRVDVVWITLKGV